MRTREIVMILAKRRPMMDRERQDIDRNRSIASSQLTNPPPTMRAILLTPNDEGERYVLDLAVGALPQDG